jgi:hypothetical protein
MFAARMLKSSPQGFPEQRDREAGPALPDRMTAFPTTVLRDGSCGGRQGTVSDTDGTNPQIIDHPAAA